MGDGTAVSKTAADLLGNRKVRIHLPPPASPVRAVEGRRSPRTQSLTCAGTQVKDLGPLEGLTALRSLTCGRTQVKELAPLAGLSSLESLHRRGPISRPTRVTREGRKENAAGSAVR